MTSESNRVLSRKEREELVLDLYFNQNKTYKEISKIARISSGHKANQRQSNQ
jgi:DNA-directed RNA polymerase specialized sigma subunit